MSHLVRVAVTRFKVSQPMSCHCIYMLEEEEAICKTLRVRPGQVWVITRQKWMITGPVCKVVIVLVWHRTLSRKSHQPLQIFEAPTNTKIKLVVITSYHPVLRPAVELITSIISRNVNNSPSSKTLKTPKKRRSITMMVTSNKKVIIAAIMSMALINRRGMDQVAKK